MAGDLNRVLLIGRLTRDPELKQTTTGTAYCKFGIANNRRYSVQGERKEEVSFFNCVAWGRQAEVINQYCRKGKQVAVEGRLQQRSWQGQDGQKQSAIDVVVENLQMLGGPGEGGQGGGGGGSYGSSAHGGGSSGGGYGTPAGGYDPGPPAPPGDFGGGFDPGPMDDDDIPF